MKKFNVRDILMSTVIMLIVCVVVTSLLAGTNYLTADRIEQNNILQEENARADVLKMADNFKPIDMDSDGETDYYEGYNGDDLVGYVMTTSAKGYGGDVSVMTGILFDGKINKIAILSHSETPGLGANADTESFTNRFKQVIGENNLEVVKGGGASDGQIDAITGATITSTAVTNAVNEAIDIFRSVTKDKKDTASDGTASNNGNEKGSDGTESKNPSDKEADVNG